MLSAARAWTQDSGFYVKGDLGGNVTQNTELKEFFGVPVGGSTVKFNPGLRLGAVGGYQLLEWFAPEVETAIMANEIDSIGGATQVHEASFVNVPFLLNGRFQIPTHSPFTPYFGAGVGFSTSIIDVDHITIGGVTIHGDQADTVFAYQAFAGLRYRLNDRISLGLEYHYFAADSPTWGSDFAPTTGPDEMSFGHTRTHAISFAFEFRF